MATWAPSVYRDVDLVNAQFHEAPSHATASFQSLVRFGVTLEFMAGLAIKLAEVPPSVAWTFGSPAPIPWSRESST